MNKATANFSFLLKIQLKQITPYLHFQHDINTNPGAVLRATEVKPKLDHFIIRKMGGKETVPENWFIKNDRSSGALNYKMQFQTSKTSVQISKSGEYAIAAYTAERQRDWDAKKEAEKKMRNEINGMYFANMVDKKKKVNNATVNKSEDDYASDVRALYKETVLYNDPIQMTILCTITELREKIRVLIDEFFLLHNFGARQTKGFGGFIPTTFDTGTCVEKYSDMNQLFFYADAGTHNIRTLMNHASTLYALLKGGLNRSDNGHNPECYIKAYIQRQYLDEKYPANSNEDKTGSEKAFIKNHVLKNVFPDSEKKYKHRQYLFIRALLGLADQYNFLKADNGTPLNKMVYVYNADKDCIIERFPSPITIKIIGTRVFFLFDVDAVQPILNRLFYFTTDNVAEHIKKYTAEKRYSFFAKEYSDNRIQTPKSFTREDARDMMSGFVNFFNEQNNGAKGKLDNFGPPFQNSSTLTLEMGGKTPNA